MKKTTLSLLLAVLFFNLNLKADDVVLGEYTGEASGTLSKTYPHQDTTETNVNCHVALNIDLTDTEFAIPYSYFDCNDVRFNEVFKAKLDNGILYKKDVAIGSVSADGKTIDVDWSFTTKKTLSIFVKEPACGFKFGNNDLNYTLKHRYVMHLQKLSDGSYEYSRIYNSQAIEMVLASIDWKDCDKVHETLSAENLIVSANRTLSGTISKK